MGRARRRRSARDLRLIYTVQVVTNHLVRSGTLCEHICHAVAETAEADGDPDLEATLSEMRGRPTVSSERAWTSSSSAT